MNTKIRSHKERKQAAIQYMKNNNIDKARPVFDYVTEAFLEFFLVEDISAVCSERYQNIVSRRNVTKGGNHISNSYVNKFKYMINLFEDVIEKLRVLLDAGEYQAVQKAIKESALKRNAMRVDTMDKLAIIAKDLTKVVDEETIKAGLTLTNYNKSNDEAEDNMTNSKEVYDIIDDEENDELFNAINNAVNEDNEGIKVDEIESIEEDKDSKNKTRLNKK